MSLFIKVINGEIIDHPVVDTNLMDVYHVTEITDQFLQEYSYARFDRADVPIGTAVVALDGYELGTDGVVRDKIITRQLTQDEKLNDWVRKPRDFMLAKSDWTQMPDSPLSAEKKAEWATYRQQLRDMTTTYADIQSPAEIVPPTEPTK
jgi:hypothetical protein